MEDQQSLVEQWVNRYRGRDLTLEMCGYIFGGRYGETFLRIRDYRLTPDTIVLVFSRDERLEVFRPQSVELVPKAPPYNLIEKRPNDTALVIRRCQKLRFTWYSYGEDPTDENLCEHVYEQPADSEEVVHRERLSWRRRKHPTIETRTNVDEMLRLSPEPDFR